MATLRIEYRDGDVLVTALKPDMFTHYGFGTYLENVIPEDVEITAEALEVLLAQPERDGLQGLEFWPDNRLAWGDRLPALAIPTDSINVPTAAKEWIKRFRVINEQTKEDE